MSRLLMVTTVAREILVPLIEMIVVPVVVMTVLSKLRSSHLYHKS